MVKGYLVDTTEIEMKENVYLNDKETKFLSNFLVSKSVPRTHFGEIDDQLYTGPMNTEENDESGEIPLQKKIMDRIPRDYKAESKRGNYFGRGGNILYLKSVPILIFDDNDQYELIRDSLLYKGHKKIDKTSERYEEELREREEKKGKWKVERKKTIEKIVLNEIIDTDTLKGMFHDECETTKMDEQEPDKLYKP